MAFRWLRAYFERRDSRESYHYRQPPIYQKRGRQVEYPEEFTTRRKFTEDSFLFRWRPQRHVDVGGTVQQRRPRWITGWLGRGRSEPSGPPPRQERPYESWPGAGQSHGWVQDERPYRPWPGEEER